MNFPAKSLILAVFVGVVGSAMLLPSTAYGQSCTAATIEGSYAVNASFFAFEGKVNVPRTVGSSGPITLVGRFVFAATSDSDGTFTGSLKGSVGGAPSTSKLEGTYHVDPDCTGTVTNSDGTALRAIAIANGGAEIEFSIIHSIPQRTGGGFMKRQ